ncbi:MAG: Endo-1,4-beta-xylanase A precursor [Pelotomaculum sp. PtaB.Bin104]|nr:MAG: Endo-1,4-beta-xylanase A precursor [Pelotomaculum sp. PtaB.Bin104]
MSIERKRKMVCMSSSYLNLLVIVMVFIWYCCSPAWAATVQDAVLFEDIHAHWAESNISRLSSLELVKGYPDHTFKPDQLVNRLETVVLIIRSGGFTAEAEQLTTKNNNKKSNANRQSTSNVETKQTPKVPWGQSYINLAVEKGFLVLSNPEDYDYDGSATRLEVAELLARAMYLVPPSLGTESATAKNKISTESSSISVKAFSDLDKLSTEEQTLVAKVVNAGVMSGYPDGTFRPQEPLTRAEMAVILSRLIDHGWVKIPAGRRLTGWISGVEKKKDNPEITLTTLTGVQKLKVAKNVQCYQAGKERSLEQATNFRCEVILDGSRQVSWIDLLEQKSEAVNTEKIRGSVKMVALGEDNLIVVCDMNVKDLILPLAWDAILNGKKASKGFNSLKQGDFVDVVVAQGQVREVTPLDVKTTTGKVEKIQLGRMYLNQDTTAKKPGWFNHYDLARIVDKDGVRRGDVQLDNQVKITYLDPYPGEIDDEIAIEIKIMN